MQFHNIVVFGKQAENASTYLTKGQLVFVEGRLNTREWEDKNGQTRRVTEIIAQDIQFGPKADKQASASAPVAKAKETQPEQERLVPLEDDAEDTGREFHSAFGDEEEIKPEDIPF